MGQENTFLYPLGLPRPYLQGHQTGSLQFWGKTNKQIVSLFPFLFLFLLSILPTSGSSFSILSSVLFSPNETSKSALCSSVRPEKIAVGGHTLAPIPELSCVLVENHLRKKEKLLATPQKEKGLNANESSR